MVDAFIITTIIASLFIIGLNVFLFREKIRDLIDFPTLMSSNFSMSILFTFFVIFIIYLILLIFGYFTNLIIFLMTIVGIIAAIYGASLKKGWFIFFWLGVVISAFVIAVMQLDPLFQFRIWSLIIMGLIWMNLYYYNKENYVIYI